MRNWGPERLYDFPEVTWPVCEGVVGTPCCTLTPAPSPTRDRFPPALCPPGLRSAGSASAPVSEVRPGSWAVCSPRNCSFRSWQSVYRCVHAHPHRAAGLTHGPRPRALSCNSEPSPTHSRLAPRGLGGKMGFLSLSSQWLVLLTALVSPWPWLHQLLPKAPRLKGPVIRLHIFKKRRGNSPTVIFSKYKVEPLS